jgi:hypothetical protein
MSLRFLNMNIKAPGADETTIGRNLPILTDQVRRVLGEEGISERVLAEMLDKAAITSMRGFNRRYYQWLFKIEGGTVVEMQRAGVVEVGRGTSKMSEEHDPCAGRGCPGCGWTGFIKRWISDRPGLQGAHRTQGIDRKRDRGKPRYGSVANRDHD